MRPGSSLPRDLAGLMASLAGLGGALASFEVLRVVRDALGMEAFVREASTAAFVAALVVAAFARPWGSRFRVVGALVALAGLLPAGLGGPLAVRGVLAAIASALLGGALGVSLRATVVGRGSAGEVGVALVLGSMISAAARFGLPEATGMLLVSGVVGRLVDRAPAMRGARARAANEAARSSKPFAPSTQTIVAPALAAAFLLGTLPLLALVVGARGSHPLQLAIAAPALGLGFFLRKSPIPVAVAGGLVLVLGLAFAPALPPNALPACVAVGSFLIGGALGASVRSDARAPLAIALGALLAPGVERLAPLAARAWSDETRAALALGGVDRPKTRTALEASELTLQSFAFDVDGVVAVIDSKAGNARELRRDGRLVGSVAVQKGESQADVLTPLVAAVLAETLGRAAGGIVCVGLGEGIASGVLARTKPDTIVVLEPRASILAVKDDPGDLFHRAWTAPSIAIVEGDAVSFLRGNDVPLHAIMDLESGLSSRKRLALARANLAPGAVLVRIVRDDLKREARVFADEFGETALAFRAPRSDALILVGGVAAIDPKRLLLDDQRGLEQALGLTRMRPEDVIGTWTAGPEALSKGKLEPTLEDALSLAKKLGATTPDALVATIDAVSRIAPANARVLVEAAKKLGAPTPELCRAEGDALFRNGKDAEAVVAWNKALELDAKALSPKISLAARHLKRKETKEAKALLEGALSNDPSRDAPARYLLGKIALKEQDFARAQAYFEAAADFEDARAQAEIAAGLEREARTLDKTPRHVEIEKDAKRLAREGRLLLDEASEKERAGEDEKLIRGLRRDARARLEEAVKRAPADASFHRDLGRARAACGDRTAARASLETAAKLDTTDGRALLILGDVLRDEGDDDAALVAYQQGIARGPISSATARAYLAASDLLVKKNKLDDAAHLLEEAERNAPGHPIVSVNLGAIYARLGRKPDAIRRYERYLEIVGEGGDPDLTRRVRAQIETLKK